MSYTNRPFKTHSKNGRYTVRLYDSFDGWIDVLADVTWEDAEAKWNELTNNGVRMARFKNGGNYYSIFPANTSMLYTPEKLGR